MDAGLPIAAPINPNLAGAKSAGGLGTKASNAANSQLPGFEALLSAHFVVTDQSAALAGEAAAAGLKASKTAPQDIADEDSSLLTSTPGKSPKDTLELAVVDPNISPGAQAFAALLVGPQVKVVEVDLTAATPEATTPGPRAATIAVLKNTGALSDEAISLDGKALANPNLTAAGPPKPSFESRDIKADMAGPNLVPTGPKAGSVAAGKPVDATAAPAPYAPLAPPAPAAPTLAVAQQAAIVPGATEPDQTLTELRTTPNQDPGAVKVGRASTGRAQIANSSVATGIIGKSASAIAATPGQPEPEPSPEPQHSKLEPVLAEAAPESETTNATGQPTPQAVSNAHQLTIAAVKSGPETVSSLAAQIVRNLEGRLTRFDVQLHPADLGRVDIRVEIGARGRVKASMSFENPQSAADLRGRSEELRRALENAGFDLSGGLSFDVAGDGNQGRPAPQQNMTDNGDQHRGRAFDAAMALATDPAADPRPGRLNIYQARRAAGLDIRI